MGNPQDEAKGIPIVLLWIWIYSEISINYWILEDEDKYYISEEGKPDMRSPWSIQVVKYSEKE